MSINPVTPRNLRTKVAEAIAERDRWQAEIAKATRDGDKAHAQYQFELAEEYLAFLRTPAAVEDVLDGKDPPTSEMWREIDNWK